MNERLYSVSSTSKRDFLSWEEFSKCCYRIISNVEEDEISLVFDILDTDSDGIINKDDIDKLIFTLPLNYYSKIKNKNS